MSLEIRFTKHLDHYPIDLDLCLPDRGVTAVYGPSGAGKSTLLRVIAGLDRVDGAVVRFNQTIWQDNDVFVPPHQRKLAMVFQQPSLFDHMSVEQNIFYARRVAAKAVNPAFPIDSFIDTLQLRPLLQRTPMSLSGGEQQRVAILRALAANPALLLMDEPLASLDDKLKSDFMLLFDELLAKISIPVIYVTHSKQEVARLSQQLVLIEQGRCITQGETQLVLTDLSHTLAVANDAKCALQGTVIAQDEHHHVTQVSTQAGDIWVSYIGRPLGSKVNLVIKAKDVSLTLSKQTDTSILNILYGQIVASRETGQGKVVIKIAVNGTFLLSQITLKSFTQLNLSVGQPIFAQIKSVAVA